MPSCSRAFLHIRQVPIDHRHTQADELASKEGIHLHVDSRILDLVPSPEPESFALFDQLNLLPDNRSQTPNTSEEAILRQQLT